MEKRWGYSGRSHQSEYYYNRNPDRRSLWNNRDADDDYDDDKENQGYKRENEEEWWRRSSVDNDDNRNDREKYYRGKDAYRSQYYRQSSRDERDVRDTASRPRTNPSMPRKISSVIREKYGREWMQSRERTHSSREQMERNSEKIRRREDRATAGSSTDEREKHSSREQMERKSEQERRRRRGEDKSTAGSSTDDTPRMNTEKLWKCTLSSLRDFLKAKGKDYRGDKRELIARVVDLGLEHNLIEFDGRTAAAAWSEEEEEKEAARKMKRPREEAGQRESDEPREVLFQPIPGKNYSISELALLSEADLANFCDAKKLLTYGSKDDLLMRILEHQVGTNRAQDGDRVSSDTGECALCKDGKATRAVVPCGHLCLCKDCASDAHEVTKCPICKCHVEDIEHRESTHDETVKHTRLPHTWHGVVQPREDFLMRVPFDENSIEDPLTIRCLLCDKWDVWGESHRNTDGSIFHRKQLESFKSHPDWWSKHIYEQKEGYFRRYPLLKRIPFPDKKEAEQDAEERKVSDLKDTVECESCKKQVPELGKFCCECGQRKKKKKTEDRERRTR